MAGYRPTLSVHRASTGGCIVRKDHGNHRWDRWAPAKDICDSSSASIAAYERGIVYPVPSPIRLA
jgi:hypothetical protein